MPRNPNWTRDELILALDLYFKVNPSSVSQNHPDIVALSELLNKLPIHANVSTDQKFRNPNGVYMKLCNFLRFDPHYQGAGLKAGSKLEEDVWNTFAANRTKLAQIVQAIKDNYTQLSPIQSDSEEAELIDEEFSEGRVLTRTHKLRERNQSLTNKKKAQVLKEAGKLECEACAFDFHQVYGEIGKGFAECHHNKPVSELKPGEKTRLSDLAILCANCHRMIHRAKPWLSVKELSYLLLG